MQQPSVRWMDAARIVQRLELTEHPVYIGRRADSEILLAAPEVSRRHASLVLRGGYAFVEDLNSSHGTYVNGLRIQKQQLKVGDRFSIVDTEFEILPADTGVTLVDPPSGAADSVTEFMHLTMAQGAQEDERSGLAKLSALLDLEYRWKRQFPAEELFRQILETALDISGAQRAFILRRQGEQVVYAMGLNARKEQLSEGDFQVSRTLLRNVVESREPIFETTGLGADLVAQESIVAQKLQALACLPLLGIGANADSSEVIGLLYLDSRKGMHALSGLDERILRKLAAETGNVVEKMELIRTLEETKRYEKELQMAQEAQEHLLPRQNPTWDGFHIASFCKPTRYVGGDFYDFLQLNDLLYLILADVSGKGMSASLLSASLQAALHMQLKEKEPSAALQTVNEYLCSRTEESRFATLFLLQVDTTGKCAYWSAGHIPTYLYRAAGGVVEELPLGDVFVGMFEDATYSPHHFELQCGDVVVILSDGLTEAQRQDGEMFEEGRLKKLIEAHAAAGVEVLKERILDAVEDFVQGYEQSDDLTLLFLERTVPAIV